MPRAEGLAVLSEAISAGTTTTSSTEIIARAKASAPSAAASSQMTSTAAGPAPAPPGQAMGQVVGVSDIKRFAHFPAK